MNNEAEKPQAIAVAIIVPAYNVEARAANCRQNILAQNLSNPFEINLFAECLYNGVSGATGLKLANASQLERLDTVGQTGHFALSSNQRRACNSPRTRKLVQLARKYRNLHALSHYVKMLTTIRQIDRQTQETIN